LAPLFKTRGKIWWYRCFSKSNEWR
jgi:hypothetical protein